MSDLISSKEALIALANGEKVLIKSELWTNWEDLTSDFTLSVFSLNKYQFRLKPCTIYLNGIEVPKPFDPKDGEKYFHLAITKSGYLSKVFGDMGHHDNLCTANGAWRTEEEIKQVVVALRSVFNVK